MAKTKLNKTKLTSQYKKQVMKAGKEAMDSFAKSVQPPVQYIPKYTILVDYGKPYSIEVDSEHELEKEIAHLKNEYDEEDYAYGDVEVLDEKGEDISETPKIKKIFEKVMSQ